MNCIGHQSPGLWTHPRDHADRYNTLDYWVELAKLLERGKFDALFLADVLCPMSKPAILVVDKHGAINSLRQPRPDSLVRIKAARMNVIPVPLVPQTSRSKSFIAFS
jgi:alkanesulfonate monooxygenase SsuD/methylene tetrahydromethanopterin reductase-like flavin-dependent oxidoreductase (luciferase family)